MIKLFPIILVLSFIGCTENDIQEFWHEDAIWYQIFPDRFYNGDISNDPTIETLKGTWPYELQESWSVMPWTSEWYKFQTWEKQNGRDFYYNAQLRRYGGDIQGIIDKLDYLQDLGVNAIYLNPIFESPSAHKYGAKYYHHVDNNFGPDPDADEKIWESENPMDPKTWQWTTSDLLFLELIKEIHHRDMYIIIDGVFNHVGIPFWALDDVRRHGEKSEYASWFNITSWDDPTTDVDELEYTGWFGFKDLPELSEDKYGLIPPIQEHLHSVIKRWMDPNGDGDPSDGIDGWRLDVAETVNIEFWKTFRTWVNEINPNAFLTGELWWENYFDNIMIDASRWLKGDAFHSVMNYRFADAVYKFFIDDENKISAESFGKYLDSVISDYGNENILRIQNLLGSHDTERFSSACANPDRWIDHANNLNYNPEFKINKPSSLEYELQKQIIVFQFTFPGTPYLFYGDEVGMWGADDPDCRKPMVWSEFEYDSESLDPFGNIRKSDNVGVNRSLFTHYQSLINLRKKFVSLRRGDYQKLYAKDGIFAFSRRYNNEQIISIFNVSNFHQEFSIDSLNLDGESQLVLLLGIQGSLPPHSYSIYEIN